MVVYCKPQFQPETSQTLARKAWLDLQLLHSKRFNSALYNLDLSINWRLCELMFVFLLTSMAFDVLLLVLTLLVRVEFADLTQFIYLFLQRSFVSCLLIVFMLLHKAWAA